MGSFARMWVAVVVASLVGACATTSTPAPRTSGGRVVSAPQRKRIKLAVLPVDSDVFPRLAKGINALFRDVQVRGIDDYFLSKVTLEVVQLSIECVDLTNECWAAVGKSLASDKLLLAQIARGPKRHDRGLRVTVTLFDVEGGQPVHVADRQFKSEDDAIKSMHELIDLAIGEASSAGTTSAAAEAR